MRVYRLKILEVLLIEKYIWTIGGKFNKTGIWLNTVYIAIKLIFIFNIIPTQIQAKSIVKIRLIIKFIENERIWNNQTNILN